ncbi:MAG: hypothetical protein IPL33_07255 [Sphingobacteriales bacterium]|nr:hypothetical protein [Sphingobacteriales bacterium]
MSNLPIGEYTVSVTDQTTGCAVVETFGVNGANTALQVSLIGTTPNCSSGTANGSSIVGWFNGIGAFDIAWSGTASGTATAAAGSLSYTIDNLSTGNYTVTVTDTGNGNCTGTAAFTINTATPLDAILGTTTPLSGCNTSDATANITTTGGTPFTDPINPYQYAWSHDANLTTNSAAGLAAGSYIVSITDAADCMATVSFTVDLPTITADFLPIPPTCVGTTLILSDYNGAGSGTYTWHSATPPTAANAITTLTPTANTTVYIQYTENGCIATAAVSITTTAAPTFSVDPSPVCAGSTIALSDFNGAGTGTFTWYDNLPSIGNIITTLTPLANTDVWVLYAENSCQDSLQLTISVTPVVPPALNITPTCMGETIVLANFNGAGTGIYTWYDTIPSMGNPITSITATAGASVWVLYAENGCSDSLAVDLPITPLPNIDVTAPISICLGNTATLTDFNGSGTGTYTWYDAIPSVGNAITTLTPIADTSVWVLYTENACADSLQVDIQISPPPIFDVSPPSTTCTNQTLILSDYNGTQSGTFVWYDAPPSTGNVITTLTPAANTNVWVLYTENGCTDSLEIAINVTPTPTLDINSLIQACEGDVLIMSDYNGNGGGTYEWFNGLPAGGNSILSLVPPDDMSVWVLYTENACADSLEVSIFVNAPPFVTLTQPTPLCNTAGGANPTSIDLNDLLLSGDDSGTWADTDNSGATGNANNLNFEGVAPGSYTFTYTTNSAIAPCVDISPTVSIIVEDCNCPSVAINTAPISLCTTAATYDLSTLLQTTEAGTWSISNAPAGATAAITGNNFNGNGSAAGIYTLLYTLSVAPPAGCPTTSQTLDITLNAAPEAGTDAEQSICNNDNNIINLLTLLGPNADTGGIWALTSGTTIPNAFDAANGIFNPQSHPAADLVFTYTVSGNTPCPNDAASITLHIAATPNATVNTTVQTCNTIAGGSAVNLSNNVSNAVGIPTWVDIDASGASGTPPNLNFDSVAAGSYDFGYTLSDPTGICPAFTATVTVNVAECICADISLQTPPIQCQTSGTVDLLDLLNTPQTGTFDITNAPVGSNPVTQGLDDVLLINNSDAGDYTITFTLATPPPGCPNTSTTILTLSPAAPEAGIGSTTTICNNTAAPLILSDYVSGEQNGGNWIPISGTPDAGAFDAANATLDANGHTPGNLVFAYVQSGIAPCANDTAWINLTLQAAPNAGIGSSETVCTDAAVAYDLNAQLSNADLGGTWSVQAGNVGSAVFDAANGLLNAPAGFAEAITLLIPCRAVLLVLMLFRALPLPLSLHQQHK